MKFLFFTLFIFSVPNFVFAKQPLKFITYDYLMPNDPDITEGDQYLNAIFKELNQNYDVEHETLNAARMLKRLASEPNTCSYNILKTTEREKDIIFSDVPSSMFLQRKLFTLKGTLKDYPDSVSVDKLLSEQHILGIIGSTSYQELDDTLAKYPYNILPILGANSFSRLIKLLLRKRVDMVIDYELSVQHFLTKDQAAMLDIRTIREYPKFNKGFFVCNKSDFGAEIIEQINQFMRTKKMQRIISKYHFDSFEPHIAKQIMQKYHAQYWQSSVNE